MDRLILGTAAGLALGLALTFGVRAGASPAPQEPVSAEGPLLRLAFADRTPVWRTFNVEDKLPAMLLRAPEGRRFVLTDLWLLSNERLPAAVRPPDRLWLESVRAGERTVVFDQPVSELPSPLRWETGVAFEPGEEAWISYSFFDETKKPRRVHFSGYYEPAEPQIVTARLQR